MNSTELKGYWNQLSGQLRKQWGQLTDDDVAEIKGDRDMLIGKIQERYGIAKDEAERQVDEWRRAA
ncbi:MAG: CsbD family protein [Minwuia sp.]|uniref:CsbD family protein n=1 Tax=Minwuia sp. TaxID=2493630 RepID=UPI003A8C6BBF